MTSLQGIRVLDLSRLAPGPYCTMLLGDMGADILLVEAPPQFVTRTGTPAPPPDDEATRRRRAHNALGRNKRSIVINLREEQGRDVFYKLCEDADVVLEGFRPGVVDRLGVDYETVSKINPGIVYCSLSGYGQTGPYRDIVGHDINYISIGGALGLIGRPGQPPAIPQNVIADFAGGGLMAAFSITSALLARERTGRGQFVDIAMSDGVLYLLASAASGVLAGGNAPQRGEETLSGASPHYDTYECSDGKWLSLGSLEPHFWAALCEVVGREDFKELEYDRSRHPEIREHFEQTFRAKTRDEWFAELQTIDICVAPVYALDEALEDPHNVARNMVVAVDDPQLGTINQIGIGPKFSETPGEVKSTTPQPGADTDDVLASAGFAGAAIEELRASGVVA
ncbi:MAG TPA: CaiB/BaiF CoA-transferase family protein [Dehalococcoidia bacterium]|nr:CaiB/BaiF CoA-transferase family protein [Dehalococcoidia bacterium]